MDEKSRKIIVERVALANEYVAPKRSSSTENKNECAQPQTMKQTLSEKQSILNELLTRDIALFLERFGRNLDDETIQLFEPLRGDYEVNYWINQLKMNLKNNNKNKSQRIVVQNRRFEKMQQLEKEGEYFSIEEMKNRNPTLYAAYIGIPFGTIDDEDQTQTENQQTQQTQIQLSQILLQTMDNLAMIKRVESDKAHLESYTREEFKANEEAKKEKQHMTIEKNAIGNKNNNDIKQQQTHWPNVQTQRNQLEQEDEKNIIQNANNNNNNNNFVKTVLKKQNVKKRHKQEIDEEEEHSEMDFEEQSELPNDHVEFAKQQKKRKQMEQDVFDSLEPSEEEKQKSAKFAHDYREAENDFREIMKNKFLNGEDIDFNYENVDKNEDLDDLVIRARDEEERYFDAD